MSSNSLAHRLPNAPRRNLASAFAKSERPHQPLVKGPELEVFRAIVGRIIERARSSAGITKQQASIVMGYGENQKPIGNWEAGIENPNMARLWMLGPLFRRGFLVAWADECADDAVSVSTVVTLRDQKGRSA